MRKVGKVMLINQVVLLQILEFIYLSMLHYLFGKTINSKLFLKKEEKQSGFLELENANVRWFFINRP